jgi:arginyl-tRNA synthetase
MTQNSDPSIEKAVQALFDIAIDKVEFQTTRKEFEGDITMVSIIKSY